MSLAEDDGMIKALPSDRANKSLRIQEAVTCPSDYTQNCS